VRERGQPELERREDWRIEGCEDRGSSRSGFTPLNQALFTRHNRKKRKKRTVDRRYARVACPRSKHQSRSRGRGGRKSIEKILSLLRGSWTTISKLLYKLGGGKK